MTTHFVSVVHDRQFSLKKQNQKTKKTTLKNEKPKTKTKTKNKQNPKYIYTHHLPCPPHIITDITVLSYSFINYYHYYYYSHHHHRHHYLTCC